LFVLGTSWASIIKGGVTLKHFIVLPLALSTLLGLATRAHAAIELAQPASTYAEVQGGDAGIAQSVTDGSLLSYQSGGYLATAQSDFGVNRVYASAAGTTGSIGASSVWTDKFTVNAPIGQAVVVSFSVLLSGTNSAPATVGAPTPDGGGEFDLLIDASYHSPQSLLAGIDVPNNLAFIKANLDNASAFNQILSNAFVAHGGDTFYVSSVLSVGAARNQVVDFAHSAHFGINVGPEASLATSSGVSYAAAVPEADSLWMAVMGLTVVGLALASARPALPSRSARPEPR
jgi:hypothetical protein